MLLEFWKTRENKNPRVFLIHVLDSKRDKGKDVHFSQEELGKFIADKIKKEFKFSFEYYQIYSFDIETIKSKICSIVTQYVSFS